MKRCIFLNAMNEEVEADLYGIYQEAELYKEEPIIGGRPAGMRAWVVALVYNKDIGMRSIDPVNIKKIYEVEE